MIPHGNAVSRRFKHRQIIAAVTEGPCIVHGDIQMFGQKLHGGSFRKTFRYTFIHAFAAINNIYKRCNASDKCI